MPMLAERRRKTKWANPGRQALWKRDSGDVAFGREMLEKMGWKVGQGLGAKEQGIKEPLKISFKNDNKGVGFKDNDNEWIQQQSEFDEFLNKLSSEEKGLSKDSQTSTVQSLEERSRLSKARVHYHKFTRGKDLTKYSKKDLECITGRNEKGSSEISGNMEGCNENIKYEDKSLITAGSMADYFAKKFQNKKIKKDDCLNIMDPKAGESLLGGGAKDEAEENVDDSTMECHEKRGKKSKEKKEKDESGCVEEPCDQRGHKIISSPEGGKKSKKTKTVQENDHSSPLDGNRGCEMEATETELTGIPKEEEEEEKEIENIVESTIEFHEKRKKKSKKKMWINEGDCIEEPCDGRDINNSDHKMESTSEQGKKSKKTKTVQENDHSSLLDGNRGCEMEATETEITGIPKEEDIENLVESKMEFDEKRKKKSKKKKEKDEGGCVEEPCDERDYKIISSSEGGKKSKKIKTVQENEHSSPLDGSKHCENEIIEMKEEKETENMVESTLELEEKRKKKSKKKKEKDEGGCIEEPCDGGDINNCDHKLESSEGDKRSKTTKTVQENGQSNALDSKRYENETTKTEFFRIQKEKKEEEEEKGLENMVESTLEFHEKRKKKSKKKKEIDESACVEEPCGERDYKIISSSQEGKKSKKTKILEDRDKSNALDGSKRYKNETTKTEFLGIQKEKEEENVDDRNLEGDGVPDEKLKKKKKKRKKEENLGGQFDTESVKALSVSENKDGECKETQEKEGSIASTEEVTKKKKTSKRDRRVIIDEDDERDSKEKIKKKKKYLEAENRFNYEDCGTNENYLDPVSHTETDSKKEKAERKSKCESAVGNKQETEKIEREGIVGEDPLLYKVELLKKENSLKGTSRNKLLNLIYSTNIEQFSGSNLGGLSGYGVISHR